MKAAHTPGPWVVWNTDSLLFGRPQGNGSEPIGFVFGPSFPERSAVGQRAMADARLCAAAPELLEALQALIPSLPPEWWLEGAGMRPVMKAAYKAIAKATGSAS